MARVHDVNARKSAFMDDFEGRHLAAKAEEAPEAKAEEQPTDESAAPAVIAEPVASTEKKDESAPTPKESAKATPEGYVRKEALDEERSRRKRLSQKLKDVETRLQQLESGSVTPPTTQSEDTVEELTERERALAEENRRLKAEQIERAKAKEQETVSDKQSNLEKQIAQVDKELRDDGFPGFKLGVHLVDRKMREMLQSEEIDDVDYLDPKMWKRVYVEAVHAEVAKEFGFATKQAIADRKNSAKQDAAKVSASAGAKAEQKKQSNDEDGELDPEKEREEYRKLRQSPIHTFRIYTLAVLPIRCESSS